MKNILMIFLLTLCLTFSNALCADKGIYSISPKAKSDGKKWRIGYYESGSFKEYLLKLRAFIQELSEIGWIEKTNLSHLENIDDTNKFRDHEKLTKFPS